MAKLEVVWRNPNKIKNQLRYSPQTKVGERNLYTVQQLLSGEHDVWVNMSVLEVISRPSAPRPQPSLARLWNFEFGS
jgi:hypothetical protein